jgi:signal transduction histidine kinase
MANIGEAPSPRSALSAAIHEVMKILADKFTQSLLARTMRRVPENDPSQRDEPPVPYRGHDRRAIITRHETSTGRPFFIAGFGLVLLTAVVFALGIPQSADDLVSVAGGFELSAGALGIVAATLGVVRWRLAGDARALWIGTAVGFYSVFSIALVQLLPQFYDGALLSVTWIRPVSLLVTLAVFVIALRSPEVDARLQPGITFGLALLSFIVLALLVVVSPLAGWLEQNSGEPRQAAVASIIALIWAGFATVYILRGMRDGRLIFAWYGLTMFGLTLAELTRALNNPDVGDLAVGSAIIRCIALLYAVIGVTRELQMLFANQSIRLLQTTVDTLSSHASLRAAQERQEELAHEARNALTAIEGATQTLERFRDNLDDDTRRALALAVSDEIGRLQRMVGASQQTNHPVSFRLSDIVRPQIDLVRAQGAQVETKVSDDVVAYGRPADFAEVLQNLLVNARVHGRNPISVSATSSEEHILVRVEDRGPGVPPEVRAAIFERGRRASNAPGSGLGLYLSRQLMVDQNGSLWVEDRPGGGACFVLAIPAGPTAMSLAFTDSGRLKRRSKNGHNGGQSANGHRPLNGTGAQRGDTGARARFRQAKKPLG